MADQSVAKKAAMWVADLVVKTVYLMAELMVERLVQMMEWKPVEQMVGRLAGKLVVNSAVLSAEMMVVL